MYVFSALGADAVTFAPFPKLASTEPEFRQAIVDLAQRLGVDPNHLAGVMSFESQFSPSVRNRYSGAVGLIQFLGSTAESLGTTAAKLQRMTRLEQMRYVEKHFRPYGGRMKRPQDVYLAVFSPAYIGKPDDVVMARSGTKAYSQNRTAFDKQGKGFYTVGDVSRTFLNHLAKYSTAAPRVNTNQASAPDSSPFEPDDRLDFSGNVPFEWEKLFLACVVSGALIYGYVELRKHRTEQRGLGPVYRARRA